MIKIAPSILSADFSNLAAGIETVEKAGADYLHIDVMDGHFVPNITIGPPVVKAIKSTSSMVFDVHLMIENPQQYIDQFVEAGANIITVHVETCTHLHRTLSYIKEKGVKAGVALNPATPAAMIDYVISRADLVLVMTVNPGFGGQSFLKEVLSKITMIRKMLDAANSKAEIEVDGGINSKTAPLASAAGAGVLVAGSSVFNAADPEEAIRTIREGAISAIN